jgi:putative FmdB family regulatory protein
MAVEWFMPFYEYECRRCGHQHEAMQKISDPHLRRCPACGRSALKRLVSAAAFRLKGAGWYETDFKRDGENKRNLVAAEKAEAIDKAEKPDKADKAEKGDKAEKTEGGTAKAESAAAGPSSSGSAAAAAKDGASASKPSGDARSARRKLVRRARARRRR